VDLRDAEITCDLTTEAGRATAVDGVREASGGRLVGAVACAGIGPQVESWGSIVALNYFGAVAFLAGLRDALQTGAPAAAVAVSSNSSRILGSDGEVVTACLAGDETAALRLAPTLDGSRCYGDSKLALARWVRRQAPTPEWAGSGIRLNAIAPGASRTPLLEAGLDDPLYGELIRGFPIPTGDFGTAEQIAAAIAFLLSDDASFCCGSVLYCDGGSDALLRPDDY
jgi:NAD(P)-dependent dehydrogenase (short-subunit alcohol dehydrogenase family)